MNTSILGGASRSNEILTDRERRGARMEGGREGGRANLNHDGDGDADDDADGGGGGETSDGPSKQQPS